MNRRLTPLPLNAEIEADLGLVANADSITEIPSAPGPSGRTPLPLPQHYIYNEPSQSQAPAPRRPARRGPQPLPSNAEYMAELGLS